MSFLKRYQTGVPSNPPVPPPIFIMMLEPLLPDINNQNISPLQASRRDHKVARYADDLFCFVTWLHISLQNLMVQFWNYSGLSDFNINIHKSELLNLNLLQTNAEALKPHASFKCAHSQIH